MTPGLLLRAVRAPSLLAGAMPVVLLTALVASSGLPVHGLRFVLTLVGVVALQAGVNVVNDLFDDESGLDADPDFAKNPFPLGSRMIQGGHLTRRGMWGLAAGCFGVGAVCGLVLDAIHPGHVVLGIGVVGALLGWFYTARPLRLAYHGVGEPVIWLLFGPLAGVGTWYVQTGGFAAAAGWLSAVAGWLAMTILFMHHFPQHEADARHGKKTPVVRLGPERAGRLVPWLLLAPYLAVAGLVAAGFLPLASLAFVLSAPLAVLATRTSLRAPRDPRAMTAAFGQVMLWHLVGGALLAGALLA